MRRKICPICDTKLGAGSFCPVCKRWIRHPLYINADYYLNERHSADERDCEYHQTMKNYKAEAAVRQSETGQRKSLNTDTRLEKAGTEQTRTDQSGTYREETEKTGRGKNRKKDRTKKKGRGSLAMILVIAYFIIMFLTQFLNQAGEWFHDVSRLVQEVAETEAVGLAENAELPENWEMMGIEESYEEEGYCPEDFHFAGLQPEIDPMISAWVEEAGFEDLSVTDEIRQQETEEEDGTVVSYSKGNEAYVFTLEDGSQGYIQIDYDLYSFQIHRIDVRLNSREEVEELWENLDGLIGASLDLDGIRQMEPDEDGWIWLAEDGYITLLMPDNEEGTAWYGSLEPW